MLPRSLASIVAAVLIGLAMAGSAQAKRLTADTFIQQWDEDHDGTLSLDEVKEAASARFDELDRKHRGKLTRNDLGGFVTFQEFRRADTNKDRTLDKDEYLALVETLFKAGDTDHDGTLDKTELNSGAGRSLLRPFRSRQGPIL